MLLKSLKTVHIFDEEASMVRVSFAVVMGFSWLMGVD
jgi:hypothetical protein